MNYFSRKFYLAFAMLAGVFVAPHANAAFLTGELKADYLCHDGANRGSHVGIHFSTSPDPNDEESFIIHGSNKGYYDSTQCWDLRRLGHREGGTGYKNGRKIYAFMFVPAGLFIRKYTVDGTTYTINQRSLCNRFTIVYTEDAGRLWVQNGGHWFGNVTCVARRRL